MKRNLPGLLMLLAAAAILMAAVPSVPNRNDNFASIGCMDVTPADANISYPDRALFPRGFIVGDAGTVKVTFWDGSQVTFASGAIATGVIHPMSIRRVWATGTSATKFQVCW